MKKYILSATLMVASLSFLNAQVIPENPVDSNNENSSAFIDASGYTDFDISVGKGLNFPRTDLRSFKFNISDLGGYQYSKTAFDGMVVYNTGTGKVGDNTAYDANTMGEKVDVKPGFYYFSNPTATQDDDNVSSGKWVRIADAKDLESGVASGDFWSLNGNTGTTEAVIDPSSNAITAGNFIGTKDNKKVTMGTNNVARLSIGEIPENVGGVDFNFVLKVYGKARFTKGIVTNNSTYPDYVFDNYFTGKSEENPNYKFKSLNEVESFIKENNHLPGVTSIKDLEKSEEGYYIDNTKLSIQTLEKVEELYLHMIEQQKEIKALKAEIAELKK